MVDKKLRKKETLKIRTINKKESQYAKNDGLILTTAKAVVYVLVYVLRKLLDFLRRLMKKVIITQNVLTKRNALLVRCVTELAQMWQ